MASRTPGKSRGSRYFRCRRSQCRSAAGFRRHAQDRSVRRAGCTLTITAVLSGAPEIASRDGGIQIVARGDTSADGLRQKLECILHVLGGHLSEMKLKWEMATAVNLYTVFDIHPPLSSTVLPVLGAASHAGLTWHYARPPVNGLDVEIDARAVRSELILT